MPALSRAQREETGSLLTRVETDEEEARRKLLRRVERAYGRLHRRLRAALTEQPTKPTNSGASTAEVLASTVAGWTRELEERLERVHPL